MTTMSASTIYTHATVQLSPRKWAVIRTCEKQVTSHTVFTIVSTHTRLTDAMVAAGDASAAQIVTSIGLDGE